MAGDSGSCLLSTHPHAEEPQIPRKQMVLSFIVNSEMERLATRLLRVSIVTPFLVSRCRLLHGRGRLCAFLLSVSSSDFKQGALGLNLGGSHLIVTVRCLCL